MSTSDLNKTLHLQQTLYDVLQAKPVVTAALLQTIVPKQPILTGLPCNSPRKASVAAASPANKSLDSHLKSPIDRGTGFAPAGSIVGRLASKQVLDIVGESQSGKLHHLYQIAISVTLPKSWRGIEYNGQGESVMWIDCGIKFDLGRFTELLLAHVRLVRKMHNVSVEAGTMDVASPNKASIEVIDQEVEAELLEFVFRRIRLIHPQNPLEVIYTLAHVDTTLDATTIFEEAEEVTEEMLAAKDNNNKSMNVRGEGGKTQSTTKSRHVETHSNERSSGTQVLLPLPLTDPISTPRVIFLGDLSVFYWERRSVKQGFIFYDTVARLLSQRMQQQGVSIVITSLPLYRSQSSDITNALLDPTVSEIVKYRPLFAFSEQPANSSNYVRFQAAQSFSTQEKANIGPKSTSWPANSFAVGGEHQSQYFFFAPKPYRSAFGSAIAKLITHKIFLRPIERLELTESEELKTIETPMFLALCTGPLHFRSMKEPPNFRPWSYYYFRIDNEGIDVL